jgi:hypothetical protein
VGYSEALEWQQQIGMFWVRKKDAYLKLMARLREERDASGGLTKADFDAVEKTARIASTKGAAYYWSPQMTDLLAATAPSIPDWTLRTEQLLPAGFMLFAKPIVIASDIYDDEDDTYNTLSIDALCWTKNLSDGGKEVTGVAWPEVTNQSVGISFVVYSRSGRDLLPIQITYWSYGERLLKVIGPVMDDTLIATTTRLFAAILALIDQRILVSDQERPDRATRRRLGDLPDETTVNVIRLRRTVTTQAQEEGEGVDWACRWVVQGHWRQQPYPSTGEVRPIWITPYIKGPEDKPLKAINPRVFAVIQ